MAFLFGDSFDDYATADITKRWTGVSGGVSTTIGAGGRNSTNAVILRGSPFLYKLVGVNCNTMIVGFSVKFTQTLTTNPFLYLQESGVVTHVDLRLDASGYICVTRNGSLLETSTSLVSLGVVYHIQLKVKIDDGTSGTWELRVNGVTTAKDVAGGDTRNAGNNYVNLVGLAGIDGTSNVYSYWDDAWVCDNTGATCNDFLGDIRGISQFANADGTYTDFTPSAGDRHDCINKITPTADASYIKSLTPGHKGTFSFPALGVTGNVKAVVTNVYANKSDAGTRVIKPISKSGASAGAGANYSLSDSGLYIPQFVEEVDPATSAAWLVAGVDAEEVGVEMVS